MDEPNHVSWFLLLDCWFMPMQGVQTTGNNVHGYSQEPGFVTGTW